MHKLKRIAALALAATMVMGCSLTAFADTTSGGTDGAGTPEGHVDKKVINVVLPTVESGSTPFAYTMDPERLIQETSAAKYAEGTVFPAAASDTGVYFQTGDKTYANTSNTLQAINKSSHAIKLTVKVKATQNTTNDIALASSSTVSTTEGSPNLYLALKVGDTVQVVSSTEETVDKVIPGVPGNFETAVVSGAYTYKQKDDATAWKAVNLSMTGAVSALAIASDTTAPTVSVTWSYAEAASTDTADTDVVDYSTAPATYTVTYKANDGAATADKTESVNVGSSPNGPESAFTREGYTFKGWGTSATATEADKVTLSTITEATTLFAIWEENPTAMHACSLNNGVIAIRLVDGQNADASKITSVKVGDAAVASTSYSVTSSGAIKINNVTATSGTVTIVYDGTTYQGTF